MEYRRTEHNERDRSDVGSTSIKTTNPLYRPPPVHPNSQLGFAAGTQYSLSSAPAQEVYSPQFTPSVPSPPQPAPFHMPMQFAQYPTSPQLALSQAGSYYNQQSQSQYEELKKEKEKCKALESELESRAEDRAALRKIQKKYNNLF